MEAIQDALTSILADDTRQEPSPIVPTSPRSVTSHHSAEASPVQRRRNKLFTRTTSPVPIIRPSDGLLLDNHSIKRPLLRGRTASYNSQTSGDGSDLDAGEIQSDAEERSTSGSGIRLAAPGNLQLPAEIVKIGDRIVKLQNQETVLSALLRKAELTGNSDETKILVKSIDALRREVSELSFQKRQFEMQADENKLLPGRTSVGIIGTTVGHSQGKDFALYLVEVHQLAEDGKTQISGWLVTRRFSEFVALHANLKDKLPAVKSLDLPQKRLVTSMSNTLLEQRKQGLTKYLKSLIKIPGALANRDVRAFLSQQNISLLQAPNSTALSGLFSDIFPGQGIIRNLFRTVTSGMDDMFGGPSMLDAIILRLSQQAADFAGTLTPSVQSEDLISSLFGGFGVNSAARSAPASDGEVNLLSLPSDIQPVDGEGLTSFTAPIANFLVEVFDLKEKGSWLRRQAIVIILQQVLGGTIERKVREAVNLSVAGDALLPHIEMLKELVWPGGKMRPASLPRSAEEKLQTRDAAFRKLTYLMPGE
jgi:sorting nexin-25